MGEYLWIKISYRWVAAGLALPKVPAHPVDVYDQKLEDYGKLHFNFGIFEELGTEIWVVMLHV